MATSPLVILFLAAGLSYQEPAKARSGPRPGLDDRHLARGRFSRRLPRPAPGADQPIPSTVGTIEQKLVYVRAGGCLFTVQRFRYPVRSRSSRSETGWPSRGKDTSRADQAVREGTSPLTMSPARIRDRGALARANGTVTSLTRHFIKGPSYYD